MKIQVSDTFAYYVQIQQVEKTGEDPDLPISTSETSAKRAGSFAGSSFCMKLFHIIHIFP